MADSRTRQNGRREGSPLSGFVKLISEDMGVDLPPPVMDIICKMIQKKWSVKMFNTGMRKIQSEMDLPVRDCTPDCIDIFMRNQWNNGFAMEKIKLILCQIEIEQRQAFRKRKIN